MALAMMSGLRKNSLNYVHHYQRLSAQYYVLCESGLTAIYDIRKIHMCKEFVLLILKCKGQRSLGPVSNLLYQFFFYCLDLFDS